MKRNLELVREILLATESKENQEGWFKPEIEGSSNEEVVYHIKLLIEAGLVDGVDLSTKFNPDFQIRNLTWDCHEFLDSARDKSVWTKVKETLGPRINTISFSLLKHALQAVAKEGINQLFK